MLFFGCLQTSRKRIWRNSNPSTRWTDRSFGVLCDFVDNSLLRLLLCVLRFRWNEDGVC